MSLFDFIKEKLFKPSLWWIGIGIPGLLQILQVYRNELPEDIRNSYTLSKIIEAIPAPLLFVVVVIGFLYSYHQEQNQQDVSMSSPTSINTTTSQSQSGGQTAQMIVNVNRNETSTVSRESRKTDIELTPVVIPSDSDLYLSVRVRNNEERSIYCIAQCRSILQEDGKDIKRDVSGYANHFSWAGGSSGKKEIPGGLDATINLVRRMMHGSGINFTFQENTETNWQKSGLYTIEVAVTGEFESRGKQLVEITPIRIQVSFEFSNIEERDGMGGAFNRSTLSLVKATHC